jgi:hypothetical protein
MTEIRLVGESVAPDRGLYLASFSAVDEWPRTLRQITGPFVVFTAFDAEPLTDEELRRFARLLLDQGCVYSCSWGPDCHRMHTAFDLAAVDAEKEAERSADRVATTWHENESLDDALWYAVFAAHPDDAEARALLAVAGRTLLPEIESRLSDSQQWSKRVLDQDEGRTR